MDDHLRTRGIMRVGSRSLLMVWKAWVAILLIGAGVGEAFAIPAQAVCDSKSRAALTCCCSHDCASSATSGPGMRSGCCDMRRAPAKNALPTLPPREAAPLSSATSTPVLDLPSPDAPIVANVVFEAPPSFHAPPLYDLFRSYRI